MVFRILTIDGGGVRGIYPAHILASLTKVLGPLSAVFDLVAGTSTGSIIAGAVATGADLEHVTNLYESHAAQIFSPRLGNLRGVVRSAYSSEPLRALLRSVFANATFADVKTRLMVIASDVSNGSVFVMKSPYLASFVRDADITLVDGICASCAAPTYFDPVRVKEYLLADGGLWANNPSLVAYTEAVGKLHIPTADVRILSIGTGSGHQYYDVASAHGWGLATGWGRRLIDTIFNLQSVASSNMATLLLEDNYLRISFAETGALPLDDPGAMPHLKANAADAFTHNVAQIKAFLQL